MHPAIRILCLLVALGLLVRAQVATASLVWLSVLLLPQSQRRDCLTRFVRLLRRLRWLFVSIALVYLLFTPGMPISALPILALITDQGLHLALQRLYAWLVIVYLFAVFFVYTSTAQWQSGLYRLLQPLRYIGGSAQQLTLRIALTLQAVNGLEHRLRNTMAVGQNGSRVQRLVMRLSYCIQHALQQAENAPLSPIQIDLLPPPRWYEWSYPVLIGVLLALLDWGWVVAWANR